MSYRRFPKYDARRYQCAMLPWLKARHIHHTTYRGPEWLWVDMLPLSVTGHWVIHVLAGGSGRMAKAVTRQNRNAKALPLTGLWRYPNPAQRALHAWCRVPWLLRATAFWVCVLWVLAPQLLQPPFPQ
jgi:hypothetical protein